MGKIILNSKGINTKTGSLQIRSAIYDNQLKNPKSSSIFVVSPPDYGLDTLIQHNLIEVLGFSSENVYFSSNGIPTAGLPDYIYVTEGNAFEILWYMQESGLLSTIREIINKHNGVVYIGSSAGAIIAGIDILIAKDFDVNPVGRMDYTSLGLIDGTVIPHCGRNELELYKRNNTDLLNTYHHVYFVGNDDVLII